MDWVANRGQVIQILGAVLSVILAGINAWPNLQSNRFLSLGAILFYVLVLLVVVVVSRNLHRSTISSKEPTLTVNPAKLAVSTKSVFTDNKEKPLTYPLKLHLAVTNTQRDPVAIESQSFELSGSLRLAPNATPIPGTSDKYYRPRFRVCRTVNRDGEVEDQYEERCVLDPQKSILAWVPIDPAIGEAALTSALNSKAAGIWRYRCVWLGDRITNADYEDKL